MKHLHNRPHNFAFKRKYQNRKMGFNGFISKAINEHVRHAKKKNCFFFVFRYINCEGDDECVCVSAEGKQQKYKKK